MSELDLRQKIQDQINDLGVSDLLKGTQAVFELACDGEGCDSRLRADSRGLIDKAHEKGFVTDEAIQEFVHKELRLRAYRTGWSVGRGDRDYCPDCLKKGKALGGDTIRKGAGRRKAKR